MIYTILNNFKHSKLNYIKLYFKLYEYFKKYFLNNSYNFHIVDLRVVNSNLDGQTNLI